MGKEEQFLKAGTWVESPSGVPVLQDALASFVCRVDNWANTKTHAVFFGLVDEVRTNPEKSPLIYAQRGFNRIVPLAEG